MYRTDVGKKVGMQILNLQHVAGVLHCGQVLAFGNILAFMLFFQSVGDPAVFFRNAAGFLRGQIAVVLLLSHSKPLLS